MIKKDSECIQLEGSRHQIKADLVMIMKAMHEKLEMDKEELTQLVDLAFYTNEELKQDALKEFDKFCDDVDISEDGRKFLKKLLFE